MKLELIFRWLARCLSALLTGLIVLLAIGEATPRLIAYAFSVSATGLEFWLFFLAVGGLLVAWRSEFWGGLMGLAGIAGFYLTDLAASGFHRGPGGWVFPLLALAPVLFLLAAWRHHANVRTRPATPHILIDTHTVSRLRGAGDRNET